MPQKHGYQIEEWFTTIFDLNNIESLCAQVCTEYAQVCVCVCMCQRGFAKLTICRTIDPFLAFEPYPTAQLAAPLQCTVQVQVARIFASSFPVVSACQ